MPNFDPALQVMRDYVASNPDNWQGHAALAEALVRDGEFDEARTAVDRAYELSGNRQIYESMNWSMAVMSEDWDTARQASQNLIELGGNDAFIGRMRRAEELIYFGQIDAARAEVRRAREMTGENRNWWMQTEAGAPLRRSSPCAHKLALRDLRKS